MVVWRAGLDCQRGCATTTTTNKKTRMNMSSAAANHNHAVSAAATAGPPPGVIWYPPSTTTTTATATATAVTAGPHHQHHRLPTAADSAAAHNGAVYNNTNMNNMERVLYGLHRKICAAALSRTSPRTRSLVERCVLVAAVCTFGVLLIAHRNFVHRTGGGSGGRAAVVSILGHQGGGDRPRNVPARCLLGIANFDPDADVTHISLSQDEDVGDRSRDGGDGGDGEEDRSGGKSYAYLETSSAAGGACGAVPVDGNVDDHRCSAPQHRRRSTASSTLYSYSRVKGYLLLSERLAVDRNLTVQRVVVSTADSNCFGEPSLQKLVMRVVGPDTVILNWLLSLHGGGGGAMTTTGYAYNPRTDEIVDLHNGDSNGNDRGFADGGDRGRMAGERYAGHGGAGGGGSTGWSSWRRRRSRRRSPWYGQIPSKLAVVIKTTFLYFISTTLVSFTLRETQGRMLDFTHQLQAHVNANRSVVHLVTSHLAENLVFVPIMVGMIFFLIEFYRGDKFLAFVVVSLVFLCEVFSVISLRTPEGIHFFPRIFFLLFSLYHFYLFSFPFGFSYLALACTVCFMTHSMLFFWHRYELPAVAHGVVTMERPRLASSQATPHRNSSVDSSIAVDHRNRNGFPPPTVSDVGNHGQGGASIIRPPSVPHAVPIVNLPPRTISRDHSFGTSGSGGRMSRPTSSGGLFRRGGDYDGDDQSYVYFMGGEVVMHRTRVASPSVVSAGGGGGGSIHGWHSSGSMDDSGHSHSRHSHERATANSATSTGPVPSRPPSASSTPNPPDIPDRITAEVGALMETSGDEQEEDDSLSPVNETVDDPPETSALQAILQVSSSLTPRTDNLSGECGENREHVRAAPAIPGISSEGET